MYTQLTALGLASGYCLLRAMHRPAARAGALWWAGFVLTSVAALYTHYFAAFLLLGYACYFLVAVALRRRTLPWLPASQVLGPAVLAAAAIFLIYLPWLPTMLNRLRVDRSYWQGPLKLDEALRHVAISFTTGAPETMLETEALGWLPWFGAAFLVCLAALAVYAVSEWRAAAGEAGREAQPPGGQTGTSVLFLLLALGAPVAGVLGLASRTPKFNPRYLMLASPAYLLLLAGGIAALLSFGALRRGSPGDTVSTRPAGGLLRWVAAACGIAILLLASAIPAGAQVQWLTGNPAFTKAQWREAAAAVRSHIQPGEAVLLVSGHAEPAWDYYAPDIPATRLPNIDVLDVQAVLGFEVGPVLQSALAGKSGAWLVSWQNQVVDPVGFVPFYLGRAGSETPVGGAFWQIGLRHWQLSPGAAYPASPQPQHGGGANFGHKIALLGWDAGPGDRELTLYWQALNTLGPHDYQVSLRFEDGSGRELAPRWDGRPAGYLFPTMRWSVGRPLFGRYAVPAELPAGEYYVTVAVYDATDPSGLDVMDIADNPAGKRVRLGPVPVGG